MNFKRLIEKTKKLQVNIKPVLAALSILLLISLYTGQLGSLVDKVTGKISSISFLNFGFDTELVYPEYKKQAPKFKKLLKDQWMGDKGNFVLISRKETQYYSRPGAGKKELGTLSYTLRVQLLFIEDKTITEDDPQLWGFVSYEGGKIPIGWVNLDNIARPSFFMPIIDWDFTDFKYKKGHYTGNIHINEKGLFFIKWKAEGNGLLLKGKYFGKFYGFEDMLWAKKNEFNIWKDFFYEENGSLIQELRFPTGIVITAQE